MQSSDSIEPSAASRFDELTSAQREAVQHVDGPLLILAGPGSGKTRVVTHRVAYLIQQGISPYQIVALTFTNKAASEMKVRLDALVSGATIWAGTFHAFCARLLRQHASLVGLTENFSIYDMDEQKKAMQQAIIASGVDLFRVNQNQIASEISRSKNNLVRPDDYQADGGAAIRYATAQVYPAYQQVMLDSNAVDFDDLLMYTADLLRNNPELRAVLDERFRYILVDEYQDTNFSQYAIVRALSIDHPNLAVTGDPDQSIYGWRGANIDNILGFERDFPAVRVVRLEQNYRSTKKILRVADALIVNNTRRKHKDLFTENDEGEAVSLVTYPDEESESEDIADQILFGLERAKRPASDFAILYRVNAMSRRLERSLRQRGIPYQIVKGTEFYQRKEVKDVLAYLVLVNNPKHNVAFERIVNVPSRKIGKVTLDRLRQYALDHRLPFLEAARDSDKVETIQKRASSALKRFAEMMDRMRCWIDRPLPQLVEQVLQETGYREWLMMEDTDEADDRLANVDELVNAMADFSTNHPEEPTLEAFLQEVALVSDTDGLDTTKPRVTLMTLHSAKGLEFPSVHIVGIEQGIIPHQRSMDSPDEVEEERRLLFVGMTRAERNLQLSLAGYRMKSGRPWPTIPSGFLMELPREEMNVIGMHPRSRPTAAHRVSEFDETTGEYVGDQFGSTDVSSDAVSSDDEPSWQVNESAPTSSTISSNKSPEFKTTTHADSPDDAATSVGEWSIGPRIPVSMFHEGMLVTHPEYGTGTITRLSGSGKRRCAEVEFYGEGQKSFQLAYSDLVPAQPE